MNGPSTSPLARFCVSSAWAGDFADSEKTGNGFPSRHHDRGMAGKELEALYGRYASKGDIGALAEVFDRVAPDLARLGRMLVGDQHRAEDLVQETFLTAALQPATYDRSRPLKPWLVGILVNRARTARRAAGQEFEADRLTEREVATPDAEVTRQEHLAAVGAAVSELPAKLRTVVEARLAGKETSELARELGISQGALRVRLHRALQRMRALLPPGFATAFAIMFLHSQGLAQVRARVLKEAGKQKLAMGAGGSAAAIGIGSVLMTKKVLFAVSLVGLVLLGVGLNSAISYVMADVSDEQEAGEVALVSDDEVATDVRQTVTPQPHADNRTELALGTPEPEVATVDAPTHSLSGKVLGQDDRPVADASVTAWDNRYMRGDPVEVKTNATGEFTFPELSLVFMITAQADDFACEQGLRGECTEGAKAEGLVIRVGPPVSLAGRVVDPGGSPVAGAKVRVSNGMNSTSDKDTTHVPGVLTFRGGMEFATETSSSGTFELKGLPQGSNYLSVEHAPYLVNRGWQTAPKDEIRIVLDAGLSIRGHVVDSHGLPAEGARVRMWPYWGNVHTVPKFVTVDANGDFLLTSAVIDEWAPISIGVLHEGHAIAIVPITEGRAEGEPIVMTINLGAESEEEPDEPSSGLVEGGENIFVRLLPERFLAGYVVDTEGNPLPGVELWIEGEREMNPGFTHGKRSTWEWALDLEEAETDEAGAFRFGRLYPGTYEIHAVSPEDKKLVTDLTVEAGDEDIRLVLDGSKTRKVVLTGTVTDAVTGEPIEAFTVIPMIGSRGSHNKIEDADGKFELIGYREGEIEVKIQAPGYAESAAPMRHYSTGDNVLDFALVAERTLEVSVVDSSGKPHQEGSIKVRTLDERLVWIGPTTGSRGTNSPIRNGKAVLHGLPAQRLTLHLDVEGKLLEVPVDLTQPIEGEFEVVIDPDPPIPKVVVQLIVLSGRDAEHVAALQRMFDARNDPNPPNPGAIPRDIMTLLVTSHIEIRDGDDEFIAEVTVTPLDEGYEVREMTYMTYESGTSSTTGTNVMPDPSTVLYLPAKRLTLTAKAADHRDITRVLDLTGQPGGIVEIVNLVRR